MKKPVSVLLVCALLCFPFIGGGCNNAKPQGLMFEQKVYTLNIGESLDLKLLFTPTNVKYKYEPYAIYEVEDSDILYHSDSANSYIAVRATASGATTITAIGVTSIFDGDFSMGLRATCSVIVTGNTVDPGDGKTVNQITIAFQVAGYIVESQTVMGISALVALKASTGDTLTVTIFPSVELATQAKPTYDAAAQAVGQTCKQDGKNIYYGTAAAIAVYDAI